MISCEKIKEGKVTLKTDTQDVDPKRESMSHSFSCEKRRKQKHFFESESNVSLNKQVQTCKFTKKETSKTGVSTS